MSGVSNESFPLASALIISLRYRKCEPADKMSVEESVYKKSLIAASKLIQLEMNALL